MSPKLTEFKDLLTGINTETDRLATKGQELIDKVSDSSLTGTEEQEILDGLTAVSSCLSAIGANEADPIPTE